MRRSCPCVEFYVTDGHVFVFCQLKLSASGKMVPCENVKIDWGLNAVRIPFHKTWLISSLIHILNYNL